MKIITKVDTKESSRGFQEHRVVVEIVPEKPVEVEVTAYAYGEDPYVRITSGGVTFNPKDLNFSCSDTHAAALLLHVEICKFVSEQYPELATFEFHKQR